MDVYKSALRGISRRKLLCDPSKKWRKMYICLSFDFFSLLHAQAAQSSQISPSEQFPYGCAHSILHAAAASHPCAPVMCKCLCKSTRTKNELPVSAQSGILGLMVTSSYFSSLLEGFDLRGPEDECSSVENKVGECCQAPLLAGMTLKHEGACPLQKWELSLQAAPAAAQRHAALEGCAGAPAFFPACLKKSMARGKHRETSAQLPGQGQSGGPTATWRSLAVPPAPFRRALRSAAHHLQQLCSLACPQEGCGGSRAA